MSDKNLIRQPEAELDLERLFQNTYSIKTLFLLMIGAELVVFILILATGDKLSDSWDEFGLLSFFVQWVTLICAGTLFALRRYLVKLSLIKAAVISYVLILLITGVFAGIAQLFLDALHYQWGESPETIGEFVIRCMSISAIITLVALRYFYVQQQWKGRIRLESQARIEALQARIRPHFLFNSMN
ncbi:MAG TPA: sensor histidine kinase, partial [Gammaproteobacteria bacterium]|nr:sensor histidine kinase [Gammaproteobacteria bacterium]